MLGLLPAMYIVGAVIGQFSESARWGSLALETLKAAF